MVNVGGLDGVWECVSVIAYFTVYNVLLVKKVFTSKSRNTLARNYRTYLTLTMVAVTETLLTAL